MRTLIIVAVAVVLAALLWQVRAGLRSRATFTAVPPDTASSASSSAGGTRDLRRMVLRRDFPAGVPPAPGGEPHAVVMDWGLDGGTATLVAFNDGTTSLYLDTGGGVIGAGAHEAVRRAAESFRAEADAVRDQFTAVRADDPFTMPPSDAVTFYLVTDSATLRVGPIESRLLSAGTHPLATLGERAQAVIAAIRQASPR